VRDPCKARLSAMYKCLQRQQARGLLPVCFKSVLSFLTCCAGAWNYLSLDAALSMQVAIQVVIISVVAAVVQYLFSTVIAQIGSAVGVTNAAILDSAVVGIACGLVAFYMANLALWGVIVASAGGAVGAFLGLAVTGALSS
jgi:hypothetical protein